MKTISTKTLLRISIIIAVIVLVLSVIAMVRIEKIKQENERLKNEVKKLDLALGVSEMELKQVKKELTAANQYIENLVINKISDEMYIEELEGRYLRLSSYAEVAESLLLANDIEFRKTER